MGFFVLSGLFVMKHILKNPNESFGKIIFNRVKRIYPDFLILCLVCLGVFGMKNHFFPWETWFYFFNLQDIYFYFHGFNSSPLVPYLGHTWYVSVDLIIFMYVSILFVGVRNYKISFPSLLLFLLLFSICYKWIYVFLGGESGRLSCSPLSYVDAFALGGLIAVMPPVCRTARMGFFGCAVGMIGIVGILLIIAHHHNCSFIQAYKMCHSYEVYFSNCITVNLPLFFSLLWSGIIIVLFYFNDFGAGKQWMSWLGSLSYFLYLIHFPISGFVRSQWPYSNKSFLFYIVMFLMLGAMIAIAFVYCQMKLLIRGVIKK